LNGTTRGAWLRLLLRPLEKNAYGFNSARVIFSGEEEALIVVFVVVTAEEAEKTGADTCPVPSTTASLTTHAAAAANTGSVTVPSINTVALLVLRDAVPIQIGGRVDPSRDALAFCDKQSDDAENTGATCVAEAAMVGVFESSAFPV